MRVYIRFCSFFVFMFILSLVKLHGGVYPTNKVHDIVVDTISFYDPDLRIEGLGAIRKKYNISEDDFSSLLVKIANDLKSGENANIRCFALSALMYFGTANALDYVKNEAIIGPDYVAGFKCYALISGFDKRCFDLADRIISGLSPQNIHWETAFYIFLGAALRSETLYHGRKILYDDKMRILDYLRKAAKTAKDSPGTLDRILLECDPTYKDSDARKMNILRLAECLPTNSPSYSYFKSEQEKLTAAEAPGNTSVKITGDVPEKNSSVWLIVLILCGGMLIFVSVLVLKRSRK